jgi:hypothetical protein
MKQTQHEGSYVEARNHNSENHVFTGHAGSALFGTGYFTASQVKVG